MVRDDWQTIAPGVRSCYRNGVLHIELFGIEGGIRVAKPDGVTVSDTYFDGEAISNIDQSLVVQDAMFTNDKGVVVGISFYAEPAEGDRFKNIHTVKTQFDLELEFAKQRGEKLPLDAQQTAEALMKLVEGEATIEELTAENKAIYRGESIKPPLH